MNRSAPFFAFLLVISLIAVVTYFVAIVFVDHYNRTHPEITYDLPKTADELQTPPPVRTWRCDGQIIEAVSNPFPDRCVAFDVKG
jgi:hypothetical protein